MSGEGWLGVDSGSGFGVVSGSGFGAGSSGSGAYQVLVLALDSALDQDLVPVLLVLVLASGLVPVLAMVLVLAVQEQVLTLLELLRRFLLVPLRHLQGPSPLLARSLPEPLTQLYFDQQ